MLIIVFFFFFKSVGISRFEVWLVLVIVLNWSGLVDVKCCVALHVSFYVFLCLLYFLSFCGRQGCFPSLLRILNCDDEIRPT